MARDTFDTTSDGAIVSRIRLEAGALALSVLTHGARIHDLTFQGKPCVLGFPNIADYLTHPIYAGAVNGRYGNRIAGGRFTLDGTTYQLTCNERGRTHLHGGIHSFAHRNWEIIAESDSHVTLGLTSPAGEEGYPGTLQARCTYRMIDSNIVIELTATSDAPTIVNLATHSYFNFDGGGDILSHRLEIPAEYYLPIDVDLIPTGEMAAVAGTAFDFRKMRIVGKSGQHYDHNFILAKTRGKQPRRVAILESAQSGTRLELLSTEPGLQFYDGGHLKGGFGPHAGLCLEPQTFPNSPNEPGFSDAVLRPGILYRQITIYRFSAIPSSQPPHPAER